jgi:hypothetical protein
MSWWDAVRAWFGGRPSEPTAKDVLAELRASRGSTDPEWDRLRGRLGTLVLGEADQQRLWQRAHRGEAEAARLLSGITVPTPGERKRLEVLIQELERGR